MELIDFLLLIFYWENFGKQIFPDFYSFYIFMSIISKQNSQHVSNLACFMTFLTFCVPAMVVSGLIRLYVKGEMKKFFLNVILIIFLLISNVLTINLASQNFIFNALTALIYLLFSLSLSIFLIINARPFLKSFRPETSPMPQNRYEIVQDEQELPKKCGFCEKIIPRNAKFCIFCGSKVVEV